MVIVTRGFVKCSSITIATYIKYRYIFNREKVVNDETHFYFWTETNLEESITIFSKMFKGFSIQRFGLSIQSRLFVDVNVNVFNFL